MKKILSALLVLSVFLTGCTVNNNTQDGSVSNESSTVISSVTNSTASTEETIATPTSTDSTTSTSTAQESTTNKEIDENLSSAYIDEEAENMNFRTMGDPRLVKFLESAVYSHLIDDLGKDVCINNVSAVYLSQEFIDELTYNSKSNIFFGYTLKELDEQFKGTSYLFTVENGQTVVKPRSPYDDTYDKMIRNVAIGTGVILICVTISVVTYGAGAPAASMIFAAAAKSGTIMGVSSGAISGVATSISTGMRTGDWEKAKKEGALAATESFKFSVIAGSITGGAGEAIGLVGATANGLTMNEAAIIQRESKLPLSIIKEFKSMDQYKIIKDTGVFSKIINGDPAIIRKIDPDYIKPGQKLTNLQRMQKGWAPIDPETNLPYELHHVGQKQDSVLAILTREEHRGTGKHKIWHDMAKQADPVDHGQIWSDQREAFWKSFAKTAQKWSKL